MENGIAIHLLVVDESANTPEEIANALRNAGLTVHLSQAADQAALIKALAKPSWDLVITLPTSGDLDASQVLALVKQSESDIPCIVFSHEPLRYNAEWFKAGALDIIPDNNLDHLVIAARRETTHLKDHRQLRRYRSLYHESLKRNEFLLNNSPDSIAYIHEGSHIHANQNYLDLFAYNSLEDLNGITLVDLIAPEHRESLKQALRNIDSNESEQHCKLDIQRDNGKKDSVTLELSPSTIKGESCTQLIIRQVGTKEGPEKEIQKLRQQDLLTGLDNYQHFLEMLQTAVDQATQSQAESALLYIEPENFEIIKNDIGLSASNLVLTDMAAIIKSSVTENTTVARYDNNVFTILLNKQQLDQREKIAGEIVRRIAEQTFKSDSDEIRTVCNIGITLITETTGSTDIVLTQAESACKQAQGNRDKRIIEFSVAEITDALESDQEIVPLIRHALKENEFVLQFQPIVSLHAEPGDRYEVLIRMLDKEKNIIMPGEFLGPAQRAKLMAEIDRWVIKTTAKAILNKRKLDQKIQFFIKISQDSLNDTKTLSWINKLLKAARLHGDCFVFEISEHVAINNLKAAKYFANGLKQLHCHFALDHAGRASGDFSYLKQFDVDYLKIDGSLIQDIQNETSQEVIRKIVEAARNQKFQTIAEHVQDPDCLATLWVHGINFIQGYYLQQPENSLDYDFSSNNM